MLVVIDEQNETIAGITYSVTEKPRYQVKGRVTFSASDSAFPSEGAPHVDILLEVVEGPFAGRAYYGWTDSEGNWPHSVQRVPLIAPVDLFLSPRTTGLFSFANSSSIKVCALLNVTFLKKLVGEPSLPNWSPSS
jgi:hypothetical protein